MSHQWTGRALRHQAGAGFHDFFEAAGDILPGETGIDNFPGRLGYASTDLGTAEKFETVGGEVLRGIGDADIPRGIDGESLGADGGGDHGDLGRHGFVDLQTGAAADAQGDDGDGGTPEIRTYVGDGTGDLNSRVFIGELADFGRGSTADDGEGGCGPLFADQRKDFADE